MSLYARPGDVGFTQSRTLLGRGIRWVDESPDGLPTWTNHTVLFTRSGVVGPRAGTSHSQAWAVEAQWRVEHNAWWDRHKDEAGSRIRIFRPRFLAPMEAGQIVANALTHKGEKYGYWKLGAHVLDRIFFGGRKVVSTLLFVDSRPICSYLVADAYAEEGHPRAFGTDAQGASPDSMLDHCEANSYGAHPSWSFVGEIEVHAHG